MNGELQFYALPGIQAQLTGHGQLALSGGIVSEYYGEGIIAEDSIGNLDDYLENVNDSISGYGTFSSGVYHNDGGGVIAANASAGSITFANSASLTNAGLMEALDDNTGAGGSGSLVIDGAVANTGTIEALETGDVTIAGTVTGGNIRSGNAGSLVISGEVSGAALDLSSAQASLTISGVVVGGSLQTENEAFINIAGGTLDGTATRISSSADLLVDADYSLTIKGTIDNTGTINLDGTGQQAALLAGSQTTTLTGGGQILLDDGGANVIDATIRNYVLVDVDDTISGNGALGTGNLVLDNEADIYANGGSPLFVELSTGTASVNTGVMAATTGGADETTGGELQFVRGLFTNNGIIEAETNSTVVFDRSADVTNFSAGTLTGGYWDTSGTFIFGAGLITTDAATIGLSSAGATFESGTGYTFSTLEQSLTTIAATGTLGLSAFAYETTNAITLDGVLSFGLNSSFSSGLITASATSTISGFFGTIASSLTDAGSVTTTGTFQELTFTGASEVFTGSLTGNGTISFAKGAHVSLNAGASVSAKTISLSGAGTTLSVNENLTDSGAIDEAVGASLIIASGDILTLGGASTLSGTISGAGGLGLDGGTLTLNGIDKFTGAITFAAQAASKLVLSKSALPANAIAGLASGDTIDIGGLAFAAGDHIVVALNSARTGGTLSIENAAGTVLESLRIAGDYRAANFKLGSDSAGGMLIATLGAGSTSPDDFNGDGDSDLLWNNTVNGHIDDWLIVNGAFSKSKVLGTLPLGSGQAIVGEGDFNGDGTTDLLIQNAASGALTDWDVVNGALSNSHAIAVPAAFKGWDVAAVGDFNGDGVSDILLRDTSTGAVADLLIGANRVASSSLVGNSPGEGWNIVGSGDFNGDGVADLLWQDSDTGELQDWAFSGGKFQTSTDIGALPTGWSIAGIGDFNGDGTSDILATSSTGALAFGQMANGVIGQIEFPSLAVPTGFSVVGTGDFNGDGVSDVLIQNKSNGQAEVGLVSGGQIAAWSSVGSLSPTAGWHLLA